MILKELRADARAVLAGKWNKFAMISLVYLVIWFSIFLLNYVHNYLGTIISYLFGGALYLSLIKISMCVINKEDFDLDLLFYGFKYYFKTFTLYLLILIYTILWFILLIIPGIIATLRYSMAFFIMAENPEIGPFEAIDRSKAMMLGHKWELFKLHLSFIGWGLLAILTLGIGLIWLLPYQLTSYTLFYNKIKGQAELIEENNDHEAEADLGEVEKDL